ncbi:MAG: hypothetical protein N3A65_01170 [candidate division WOR-3 bacterium]|nr:hypothetical protein [candidate division WOR-3 bacterium]
MKKTALLEMLEDLCRKLSIIVKYDRFFGRGGYCRLKQKSFFIINENLSNATKEDIFIRELSQLNINPELIPPRLKEVLKK